jgi:hypothetical protein
MRGFCSLMLIALAFGAPAFAAESVYTTHDYGKCRLIEKDVGVQTYQCVGLAGIPVIFSSEDDGSSVGLGKKGLVGDLPLKEVSFAGKTIEWRGDKKNGVVSPDAAILRYDVGKSVDGPFQSQLVIYKLNGAANSCVAATVDGKRADANEHARQIADTFVRAFRCGQKPTLLR